MKQHILLLSFLVVVGSSSGFSTSSSSSSSSFPQLTPVQETSLLVAYWRHLESISAPYNKNIGNHVPASPPLIQDLYATKLVEALLPQKRQIEFDKSPIRDTGRDILAVRTKCIDDWLLRRGEEDGSAAAVDANKKDKPCRQLVNLGAGMCARYYRLLLGEQHATNYYDHA